MTKRKAEKIATILGVAVFIFITGLGALGIHFWDQAITNGRAHSRDWRVHTATVAAVSKPDFKDDPPSIPSTVNYTDYYGRPIQVTLNMPYQTKLGYRFPLDVSKDGTIYSSNTNDTTNQTDSDPFTYSHDIWVLMLVVTFCAALAAYPGVYDGIVAHYKRQSNNWYG